MNKMKISHVPSASFLSASSNHIFSAEATSLNNQQLSKFFDFIILKAPAGNWVENEISQHQKINGTSEKQHRQEIGLNFISVNKASRTKISPQIQPQSFSQPKSSSDQKNHTETWDGFQRLVSQATEKPKFQLTWFWMNTIPFQCRQDSNGNVLALFLPQGCVPIHLVC